MTNYQTTHAPGCWSWGQRHYECALGEIGRLAEALRESHGDVLRLRDAMFRVYATAANGGDPTTAKESKR